MEKVYRYVTQSNYLVDDTIKENILFGLSDYSKFDEKRFKKAIKDHNSIFLLISYQKV